jgi:hypothetical protein
MGPLLPILLWGCNGDEPDEPVVPTDGPVDPFEESPDYVPGGPILPRECDAGDAAWVARVMPLVWGRKPHGVAETQLWAQMASEHGREATLRAMTLDLEYYYNWFDWVTDALYVARTGDKGYSSCFEQMLLPRHDGTLTAFLRQSGPTDGGYTERFNMADVIVDALVADDLSVVYRTYLFARMARPTQGANVSAEELEYNRRVNFGELFYRTYVGRNLGCLVCHNSEFSTTDSEDPQFDLTWQIPGQFERALLGSPSGRSVDEAYAMFRYDGVAVGGFGGGGFEPWNMSSSCGEFESPGNLPGRDMLEQDAAYFIQEYGPSGSVYDLERHLAAGVDQLQSDGLQVGEDGSVNGQEAFAYLLASTVATQVWATATGYDLVVAHMFPRNQGQMVRLQSFADTFAGSGFSLRELLVAVTTDPYFNPGLPSSCDSLHYGLEPVFDPWTASEPDPYRRGNGASDAVHRLPARALLRSAHSNLAWKPRDAWFEGFFGGGEEEAFQSAVGVFLRESDPGHRGTDFQGLLAFETELGTCAEPPAGAMDFVDLLLADAQEQGATVGDVVAALKDRLVSSGVAPEEQALIEDLLERPFSDPADASLEERLRLVCGAILLSPQFQLVTDPELGPVPALARDVAADCQRVAALMTTAGTAVTCEGTTLK